jgi:phage anti-repressor protein
MPYDSSLAAVLPVHRQCLDGGTKPGISARLLYDFLGLNAKVWARWSKKNIVENPYAREHEDWEGFLPDVENPIPHASGGRPTQDYVLSLDFAKRLAMMARSAKGEEARLYFLACERHAQAALQSTATERFPELRAIVELVEATAQARLLAEEAKAEAHAAELRAVRAETKADLALDQQHWLTLRQYVFLHQLLHQLPPPAQQAYGKWLTAYCLEHNIPVSREPVADRTYSAENRYHVGTIEATLPGWLHRRQSQPALSVVKLATAEEDTP